MFGGPATCLCSSRAQLPVPWVTFFPGERALPCLCAWVHAPCPWVQMPFPPSTWRRHDLPLRCSCSASFSSTSSLFFLHLSLSNQMCSVLCACLEFNYESTWCFAMGLFVYLPLIGVRLAFHSLTRLFNYSFHSANIDGALLYATYWTLGGYKGQDKAPPFKGRIVY